ncbi:MAG: phosphate propanoyltransferase [Acidobacteriota bacterium]|nr:phosphate propanoyltransferase [Acidobacteriota bacterium]
MAGTFDRTAVEKIVRDVLRDLPKAEGAPRGDGPATPLPVNVSARHIHLCRKDFEALFGPGAQPTLLRSLYQEGHFAARETVAIIGPKKRMIPELRILGPLRDHSQVELAFTDVIHLGLENVQVRMSGDIEGTPGAWIQGPAGMLELKQGVIRAALHVHMNERDAARMGVVHKGFLALRVESDAPVVFGRVHVRVDPSFKLEVHMDTDEANACHLAAARNVSLIPVPGSIESPDDIHHKGARA